VQRVTLDELKRRGKTEIVEVVITLECGGEATAFFLFSFLSLARIETPTLAISAFRVAWQSPLVV
jgi:hypothetical protein